MLKERLQEIKIESVAVEEAYRAKCKEKLIISIQIAGVKNFSTEEIEHKIDINEFDSLFSRRGVANFEEEQLQEAKERNSSLKLLETDIKELTDLFQEMNELLGFQGNKIEKIEEKVTMAADDVHRGERSLRIASEHLDTLRRNKKLMMMIAAAVVVVLLIIIISASHSSGPTVEKQVIVIEVTTEKAGCNPDLNPNCVG